MTGDQQPLDPAGELTDRLDIDFALQAAGLGVWEIDLLTNQVLWDDRCRALVGLEKEGQLPFEHAIQYIHPDDLPRVLTAIERVMTAESGGVFDETFRTLGADGGKIRWVRFWGQGYFTAAGKLYRFSGVAQDVSEQVFARQKREETQRQLLASFEDSPVGIAIISKEELTFRMANPFYGHLVGRLPEQLLDKPLLEAIPELRGQGFDELLREVITTGKPFIATEVAVELIRHHQLETIYVDLTYQPRREADGTISGILVVVIDVTQQVLSRRQVEASETKLKDLIAAAPAGIGLFVGRDLVIEHPNQTFIDIVGKGPGVEGLPLREAMPELLTEGQPFLNILDEVFTTGLPFVSPASLVKIVQNGVLNDNYYNISYTPLHDAAGEVYAILDIAIDVTVQVKAQQALEESEAHLQLLRDTVPAMIFYLDEEQRYRSYNGVFMEWFNVDAKEALGKTTREFIGEQAYENLLPYLTKAYSGEQVRYETHAPSRIGTGQWLSIVYTPHKTAEGSVLGVIVHATNVTQSKQAELALRESESRFQNLLRDATVGLIVLLGEEMRVAVVNEAYGRLIGHSVEEMLHKPIFEVIPEAEADFRPIIEQVLVTGQEHHLSEAPYRVHSAEGKAVEGYLNLVYQPYREADGRLTGVMVVVHDVTEQTLAHRKIEESEARYRTLTEQLENQVQQRTEELAAFNEELAVSNEELLASYDEMASTNDKLSEVNNLLSRSNENLQQFAYIASHDLQEPLRKIQAFGALLQTQYGPQLGEGADFIQRMQSAAARMSTLIEDLLTFSRVSTQRDTDQPTALDAVVSLVLTDLEMLISDSGTIINVDYLPTIKGDARQLGQLFQNLIINAIKFRQPTLSPVINIRSTQVINRDLPEGVKPTRSALSYYRVDVADNGIGFEQKYADRIFQVFQRLHGKSQYAGTGIGLAICEKVVVNHGGAITASSQPGQGATFSVYLPA